MQPTACTIMETPNEISRSEELKKGMREALEQTIEIRVSRSAPCYTASVASLPS